MLPFSRLDKDSLKISRDMREGIAYFFDQKVSRRARVLKVFAGEAKDSVELVQRPCGVVRQIRHVSQRSLAEIAAREPME
jgi:hypothetical protein